MLKDYLEKCRDIFEKNKLWSVLIGGGVVLGLGLVVWTQFLAPVQPVSADLALPSSAQGAISKNSEKSASTSEPETSSSKTDLVVDVKGAVNKEGVYRLAADSRVTDAIKAAGGLTAQADKKSINLAQKISDEEVIYVANQGEDISVISTPSPSSATTDASGSKEETTEKINLNTATLADLQTISGIGQKRAQDIIDYRDNNGGFKSVDDLTNVSGIGEKTLEKLKSEVSVD